MPSGESKQRSCTLAERRRAALLVEEDVRLGVQEDLVAALGVRAEGGLVAHRPRREVERRLLAEQLGGALLEAQDGGIVAEDVVVDLGLGHRLPHLGRRPRHRVAAQVDRARHVALLVSC